MMLERDAMPDRGAHFWVEDGEVMFRFVIDSGNVIGPRKATKADAEKHPLAWEALVASGALSAPPAPSEDPAPSAARGRRKAA